MTKVAGTRQRKISERIVSSHVFPVERLHDLSRRVRAGIDRKGCGGHRRGCLGADRRAGARLLRLLFRVAHAVLRNRAEAEDAVQEAFLRVLRYRDRLPELRDTRVWLVRIAWNVALDRHRKLKPQQQMDDAFAASLVAADQPMDRILADTGRLQRVMRQLDRLPAKEKQVLLLAATEEMSTAEIAAVLERSESAVRALLFRARTRLRERVEQEEGKR